MSQRTKGMLRMVSHVWLTIVLNVSLLTASGASILWWQGQQILDNYDHPGAEAHAGHAVREEQRCAALDLQRRAETPLREGEPGSRTVRRGFELDDTGGEIAHDGAGKTVAGAH